MKKRYFIVSGLFTVLFFVWIFLIKTYDVAQIGPMGTSIGFSHLNSTVHDLFGINIIWYKITEVLGILALMVCAAFALLGLVQLVKRKKISEVDTIILQLGGLYVIVIAIYAIFEKVIINYRPIIMPDATEPEASFPSSHTMLICVVMASTILALGKYIKDKRIAEIIRFICVMIMAVTVVGRLVCGVHWFTDIIGGIIISIALIVAFMGITES